MSKQAPYCRRNLELRAAEYYASIRKPEGEWTSIEDLAPQLAELVHRMHGNSYDQACKLLAQLDFDYLFRWGHYDLIARIRQDLKGNLINHNLQSHNLGRLGDIYRVFGELSHAISSYEQALAIASGAGNQRLESLWLSNLGSVYRVLGQIELAISFYEQALNTSLTSNKLENKGIYLSRLGHAYRAIGQIKKAIQFYEMALTTAQKTRNRWREGTETGNLGYMYQVLGQFDRAVELYKKALHIARETNNQRQEAVWMGHIASIYRISGKTKSSEQLHKQALVIARDILDYPEESYQLLGLGSIHLVMRNYSSAVKYLIKAKALQSPKNSHIVALKLGIAYLSQHIHLAAMNAFENAITHCGNLLDKTANLYTQRYVLATALVGQAVCGPNWADPKQRADLLAPALAEYRRALDITSAPGVARDAIRDLELIRAAGIEGLEPVFELLEGALTSRPK